MTTRTVNIVFPDASAPAGQMFSASQQARLNRVGKTTVHVGRPDSDQAFVRRIGDATALMLGWDLPRAVMAKAKRLELIAFAGIGVGSYVDLDAATAQGITVTNTPGYADNTVAEHALALLFALARRIPSQSSALRDGRWAPTQGIELRGKQLGIIGFGGIGQRMAQLGHAIGMGVKVWTPHPERYQDATKDGTGINFSKDGKDGTGKDGTGINFSKDGTGINFAEFDDLLETSDAISVHVAHCERTHGLLDAAAFARIKPGALLINTARGAIVDEAGLLDSLDNGSLAGAGLDVFVHEPLPAGHWLATHPKVIATPHSAYDTPEATAAIYDLAIDSIEGYYAGNPRHVVSPAAAKSGK